jgi:type II secretory pathway component PulM
MPTEPVPKAEKSSLRWKVLSACLALVAAGLLAAIAYLVFVQPAGSGGEADQVESDGDVEGGGL